MKLLPVCLWTRNNPFNFWDDPDYDTDSGYGITIRIHNLKQDVYQAKEQSIQFGDVPDYDRIQ